MSVSTSKLYLRIIKNTTPNQLAYSSAMLFGLASFIVLALLKFFFFPATLWRFLFLFTLFNSFFFYFIFYLALERFIYRKIKLIYKNINRLKRKEGYVAEKVNMNQNIMDDVENEVMEWAAEKKEEIDSLKETEQYRREFLGNVSHELRTPIYNIQGYLETLIDGGIYDKEINVNYLYKAAQNVERLSAIIDDLDFISRHETGKLALHWEHFDIFSLAQEVMEELDIMADNQDISLQFKEGATTTQVYADKEKIRQVLTNLITNSIKYGKEKGTTLISIYHMDKNALIEVSDNGIGIEEPHLPRLFERFYRVDSSRSRRQGGSGLGLAIVKHIIEAHNQAIHVRSKIGIGTTFGFILTREGPVNK